MTTADTLLLKAVPPKWGAGKIHVFENDHNLCGKSRETSPGEVEWGDLQEVTCQICAKGWVAARRREQQQRECAERRATRQG